MAIEKVYSRSKDAKPKEVIGYKATLYRKGMPNWKSRTVPTKEEAKLLELEFKLKFKKDDLEVTSYIEKLPFTELVDQVRKKHFSQLGEGARRYEVDIKMRILPYFDSYRLDQITGGMIEGFKDWCQFDYKQVIRRNPEPVCALLSVKSVNHTLMTLQLIFNKAVEYKLLNRHRNPCEIKKLPIQKTNPRATKNRDESDLDGSYWDDPAFIQRFLEHAKECRYYRLYLTALETGMRLQELIGLGVDQIDFKNGKIKVNRQWLEKQHRFGPTKTRRTRYVDFDPQSHFGMELKKAVLETSDPEILFPTSNGLHPTRHNIGFKYFRRICERAGVPRIRFHGLRHTFASWYLMNAKDERSIYDLQYLMGHSDVEMTKKYAHWSDKVKRPTNDMSAFVGHAGSNGNCSRNVPSQGRVCSLS